MEGNAYVVTAEEMTGIEEEAVAELGITTRILMERAGKKVAEEALKMVSGDSKIAIICGKGNNGGDGLVAARHLQEKGFSVQVILLSSEKDLSSDAQDALSSLKKTSVPVISLTSKNLEELKKILGDSNLVIDCVFGFGLRGAIRGFTQEVVAIINDSSPLKLSVDVPSGVEASTGQVYGDCVKANKTITFTCPKLGLMVFPGATYAGEVVVSNLGIPRKIIEKHSPAIITSLELIHALLPSRDPNAHKKSCGQVLVVAGSEGMTGAAVLTSEAALQSGAGLVSLGIPESLNDIMEQKLTEVMTIPLPETRIRSFSINAYEPIIDLLSSYDVLALGPGLSLNEETTSLVRRLVENSSQPVVLDADGLNAMVGTVESFKNHVSPVVITPHPGELARLFDVLTRDVQKDRVHFAKRAAQEWGVVVVLKGMRTIISSSEGTVVNMTGNAGMATAGTGDVLTGMIASFIAQGLEPFKAAILGTYLHGLSGDLAASGLTEYCLIARDLIAFLPEAIKMIRKQGIKSKEKGKK